MPKQHHVVLCPKGKLENLEESTLATRQSHQAVLEIDKDHEGDLLGFQGRVRFLQAGKHSWALD